MRITTLLNLSVSSLSFAVLVIMGYRWLEVAWAPWITGLAAILHLWLWGKTGPHQPMALLWTQTTIVLATMVSAVLHVQHFAGFAPGWWKILRSFALAEVSSFGGYRYLAGSSLIVLGILFVGFWLGHRRVFKSGRFVEFVYLASAVYVAFDYSLWRVMLNTHGPRTFLAAAGIFALEFSLLFHIGALIAFLVWRTQGEEQFSSQHPKRSSG